METIKELKRQIAEIRTDNERLREQLCRSEDVNRAFNESKVRFRTIFEASLLGNKIIGSDLKILQVNAALVDLLGYSLKEEIVGTMILDYSPQEQHAAWENLQEQLWKLSTPSFSLETSLIRKDGSIVWCQVTSILFQDNGLTLGYTIIEDITEQYILRQQKEEFISVASHELRTPVTSLKASTQLMNRMLEKEETVSDKFRQLVNGAEKSATKLTFLIADLLNSTKIKQWQLALNRTRFPVSEVLDSCCSHIKLEGAYTLKLEGNHSTAIYADQQKIEQVLINLVNNAIKYAPESREIIVRVEKSPLDVKITVTDQGPGIAAEHLGKLFDRYFRVDKKKHQASGLGLGLYICSEIIRRHCGEIGVESEPGRGASFWFTLPGPDAVSKNTC